MSSDVAFHRSKVVILDFGSQYTQVIARRVRESRVYSEILPFHFGPEQVRATGARGIILSGGPASVFGKDAPQIDPGTLSVVKESPLFEGLPSKLQVWNSHGDKITQIPPDFEAVASTENSAYAA